MKKLTDILVNLQNSPITEASFNDIPVPLPNEDRVSIALNHLSQIGEMVDDLYNTLAGLEEIDNAVALSLTSAYNCVDDLYSAVEETYGIEPVEELDDEESMEESYELEEAVVYYFMNKASRKVTKVKANNDTEAYVKFAKLKPISKDTLDYEKMKSPIEFYKKYYSVRREIQKEEFAEAVWDTFDKKKNKMAPADSANVVPPKLKSLGFKAAEPGKNTWMPTKGNVVQLFGIPMRAGKWADVFFAVTDDAKPYTVITDEGVTRFKNERDAITYMMAGDMAEELSEVLSPDAPVSEWIDDFIKSDAPQFKGKSKKERIKMALGAYYGAQKKESFELEESSNLTKIRELVAMGLIDEKDVAPTISALKATQTPDKVLTRKQIDLLSNLAVSLTNVILGDTSALSSIKRATKESAELEESVFFPKYPKDATVDDKIRIAKNFIANTKQAIAKDEKDIEGARGTDGMIQWSKIKGVGASLSDNKANLAAAEKRLVRLEKEKAAK